MAIEVCILASGSSGNSTVLRTPAGAMLIDAGIGPRTAAKRLGGTGLAVGEISAICLTHLDHDHFTPSWLNTVLKQQIRVFCHESVVEDLLQRVAEADADKADQLVPQVSAFNGVPFEPLAGLELRSIKLAHDAEGSCGFVISGFGCRMGYATDLGNVSQELIECFDRLDVLAIESNYDRQMQLNSDRPWFLKQRIMGGRGHLSNEQAFEAVQRILNRCEQCQHALPAHIVLLHRSRQCNCPKLLRKLFEQDARIAPRLRLAEQYERTQWLRVRNEKPLAGEQLSLAW